MVVPPVPANINSKPDPTVSVLVPSDTSHVYVPGILATVAQVLLLVKYLSPAPAVPSTADKSAVKVLVASVPASVRLI